jgi:L-asparagine transporter-like permease
MNDIVAIILFILAGIVLFFTLTKGGKDNSNGNLNKNFIFE